MDKKIVEIIERFKTALERRGIKNARIVLYGSHSVGTAKEYSDIDIVVVSDDFASMQLYDRLCVLGHAVADVFEPVEPLPTPSRNTRRWARGRSSGRRSSRRAS